ncbi:hypothetical protein SAMN02745130_01346 [Thiothrix eikelboomii]|uniref:Uncharacterized protein n=1 Tax=Thiothrix eikelboomii TaxID=92487 RepID=A0A1T4WB21_9GAMM|nr:hypothetical protein [Thiothrix eikelboomii]SKA74145.1 hypothetical protein SAMN02745130_01346 [Thiothrix eikelboomii]
MPKLIIKREPPPRLTRQTILFWLLGLLPVALLAGFLTGQLLSQLQPSSLKAGQSPWLPLAPTSSSPKLATSPLPHSPLTPPEITEITKIPETTKITETTQPSTEPLPQPPLKSITLSPSPKPSPHSKPKAVPATKPINAANTKDQLNNRNRPASTPRPKHKPVKSPQTVSQSVPSSRPMPRSRPEPRIEPKINQLAKPQAAAPTESRHKEDYRLLEQSLGIPLQ